MADERKGDDIRVLDLTSSSVVADYFVVVTGFNRRQIQAIAWEFDRVMKGRAIRKLGVEGYETAWWVLVDYGSVVLHIFHVDAREYYDLDVLWERAGVVDWQEGWRRLRAGEDAEEVASAVTLSQDETDDPEGRSGEAVDATYEPVQPPADVPDPETASAALDLDQPDEALRRSLWPSGEPEFPSPYIDRETTDGFRAADDPDPLDESDPLNGDDRDGEGRA